VAVIELSRSSWLIAGSAPGQIGDTAMLIRVFLGWLRGERGHCGMVAIPTIEEEDAKSGQAVSGKA
jgi:hypothetical protein